MLNKTELEKLLLTNWTKFIDKNKLVALVLSSIRDNKKDFNITQRKNQSSGFKIKISRFEPDKENFHLWAEFTLANGEESVVGTTEFSLNLSGKTHHIQTIGTIFK